MPYSTDIKDYYRRAWGLEDRPKFKHGGSWADWMTNFSDQMTFEEYLQMDIKTKKPHALDEKADGGRIGQLVQPSTDGSRPGYAGKEDPYIFTLKGRHAKKKYYHLLITDRTGGETKTIVKKMLEATPTNLKKLRKLRDQKVKEHWPNRISDEKFRELRTSDKYKNLNNEDFAEVLKGKKYKTKFGRDWSIDTIQSKQQDLKLLGKVGYKPATLTPEKEVLDIMKTIREGPERVKEYIKAGRPEKMLENFRTRVAQKVHYEKYGATPERLARSLEWRLRNPEKIKVQSMKRFAGTGLFPNGANYKEHLWRDLWRSSQTKAGERFKFVSELPPLKKTKAGTQVRDWLKDDYYKTIKFKDTKTGKIINFNNLQKYLDQTMGEGTYAKSISGYELKDTLKNQKITYKGKTGTIGGLLKQNLYSPKQLAKQKLLSPLHMQHPGGVGKNWWVNEVVFSDANLGLRDLDSTLTGKLKRAKGFTKKKALLQKYAKDVEKLPGGITSVLRSKTYGKTPTPTSVMKAAGKEAGLKGKNWNKAMSGIFQSFKKYLNIKDQSKLSSTIQSILNKKNSGLNVVDIAKWGSAELGALDDIAGKLPSKALSAFGRLLKGVGVASIPVDALEVAKAKSKGLGVGVGLMNLAEIYTNLPGVVWEAGEWLTSKAKGKEHEWKPPYETTFGQEYETQKLRDTPVEVLEENISNLPLAEGYLEKKIGIVPEELKVIDAETKKALIDQMRKEKALADQKKKEEITGVDKYIIDRFNPNV